MAYVKNNLELLLIYMDLCMLPLSPNELRSFTALAILSITTFLSDKEGVEI